MKEVDEQAKYAPGSPEYEQNVAYEQEYRDLQKEQTKTIKLLIFIGSPIIIISISYCTFKYIVVPHKKRKVAKLNK